MTNSKKRASVITMHSVCNYGTQLQAYATQKKLEEYFDEVTFVDYRRTNTYGKGLRKEYSRGNPLRWLAFLPTYFKWKQVFGNFQKKYLSITKQTYLSQEDFVHNPIKADVYFSGSDQIWNTGWNHGVIPAYYLSYAPDNKPKIAFASSFGQSELPSKEITDVKHYLKRFQKISVRESSGVAIIKKQLGLNAVQLNDPTLAFSGDFWRALGTKTKIHEKYILLYNLNSSKAIDDYAQEVSKRINCKLYRFCTRYDQVIRKGKSLIIPKIEDFITCIDNAEFVITDSFHATAFAMNLNTKLIVLPPKKYSSRLRDFIAQIQNEKCIAKNYQDFSPIDNHPNFAQIDSILARERLKFDNFIKSKQENINEK